MSDTCIPLPHSLKNLQLVREDESSNTDKEQVDTQIVHDAQRTEDRMAAEDLNQASQPGAQIETKPLMPKYCQNESQSSLPLSGIDLERMKSQSSEDDYLGDENDSILEESDQELEAQTEPTQYKSALSPTFSHDLNEEDDDILDQYLVDEKDDDITERDNYDSHGYPVLPRRTHFPAYSQLLRDKALPHCEGIHLHPDGDVAGAAAGRRMMIYNQYDRDASGCSRERTQKFSTPPASLQTRLQSVAHHSLNSSDSSEKKSNTLWTSNPFGPFDSPDFGSDSADRRRPEQDRSYRLSQAIPHSSR